jgi:bud site selection protein 31
MAKIRTKRSKQPPEGFDKISKTLQDFEDKLKDVQTASLDKTTKKNESLWEIFKLIHQKSRYVYDLYYNKSAISKELYDYCLKNRYADAMLIAKWKKQGYESLCCLKCIQSVESNNGGTCICRVPRATLEKNEGAKKFTQCVNCGCRGCSSSD